MSIEKEPYKIIAPEIEKSEAYQRIKEAQESLSELKEKNISFTKRQKRAVKLLTQEIEQFGKKYHRSEFVKPKIFYLKRNDYERMSGERISTALYLNNKLAICLKEIPNYSDETDLLDWTSMLCHELLHAKAYQSFYMRQDFEGIKTIHDGLEVAKPLGHKSYFRGFNEAITVQLTQYLVERVVNNNKKLYKEEFGKDSSSLKNKSLSIQLEEYKIYRQIFKTITTEIAEQTNQSVKETSDVFLDAYFGGHLKKMAKIIDEVYGYGTFRLLGNLTEENAGEILNFLTVDSVEEKETVAQKILTKREFAKFKSFRKIMYENKTNEEK